MKPRIGIALGDVTGIGPEVTLKALAAELSANNAAYVVLGNVKVLQQLNRQLGLDLPFAIGKGKEKPGHITVIEAGVSLTPGLCVGAPEAARAAVSWLKAGAELCLQGELDALVTAPVNKESIVRSGQPFVGQTELLSELAKAKRTAMMLLGEDDRGRWLRVALATTHVPIKLVSETLTQEKIELAIDLAVDACRDLDLPQARIAVCGLNPHAGEGGKIGTEEITVIAPAVKAAQMRKINVTGPLSADALFYYAYRGEYDAVVAMYHDQGLVPLKMIGFDTGVNWTLGLPFIRTSPDHGTAYDIAGLGKASAASMGRAISLAKLLAVKKRAGK